MELLSVLHRLMVTREAACIQRSVLELLQQVVSAAQEHIREKRHSAEGADAGLHHCLLILLVLTVPVPQWTMVQPRRRRCQSLERGGKRVGWFRDARWCSERWSSASACWSGSFHSSAPNWPEAPEGQTWVGQDVCVSGLGEEAFRSHLLSWRE